MLNLIKLFIFSSILITSIGATFAQTKGVAKAIILKGKVVATNPETKESIVLKKGSWVQEGYLVQTEKRSFVKLLFIDKSQMNLGPKSQMAITKFPKKKAGIITLMKGSLRSKVTKNYLDIKDKKKSKLFIKTKTAAMGVRGTDFLVTYNPINENTALVTFSGAVAMAQIRDSIKSIKNSQRSLERIVSSDTAVIVKKGQFSGVSPGKTQRATIPVKINPGQLETMKTNDGSKSVDDQTKASPSQAPKKKFRSIIPPGVDAKKFSNQSKVENQVEKVIGLKKTKEVMDKFDKTKTIASENSPPPEGMVNKATGEIAPVAGGFIDVGTAQYIPPPSGSAFDVATQTFQPPTEIGGYNTTTGDYQHPEYVLTTDGKFVEKVDKGARSPASTSTKQSTLVAPPIDKPLEPQIDATATEVDAVIDSSRGPDSIQNSPIDEDEIEELKEEIDATVEEATESRNDSINNSTRVKFNIK